MTDLESPFENLRVTPQENVLLSDVYRRAEALEAR